MVRLHILKRPVIVVAAAALGMMSAADAAVPVELAAAATGEIPAAEPSEPRKSGPRILKVQKALADIGLYLGPIDGHLNPETKAAIRLYQKAAGMKADGLVTEQLWGIIENNAKVNSLLTRLDQVRKDKKDAARQALLNHPATRDLVSDENNERADPTRDASACFEVPTARCLLTEASESAKAVFSPELRDWALGEVLVAQARAGLGRAAMDTVRRIHDPRLIMVALRDIAEAQAAAGHAMEALEAVEIIPDKLKQAGALLAIAGIQSKQGHMKTARETVARMLSLTDGLRSEVKRISFKTRAAVILAVAGDPAGAASTLAEAEVQARKREDEAERGVSLRYVASALAEMEQPDQALNVLSDVAAQSERTPVLMSTATAQARAGDAAAALVTADTIEAVRYRAVALGRIASTQAEMGDQKAAAATLQLALAAIEQIDMPYARSYAISRIALAMTRLHGGSNDGFADFARAVTIAGRIDDNRLRAHTLWTIAGAQARAGFGATAAETEGLAGASTAEIKSELSRVWMFCDVAVEHATATEPEAGWKAFTKGLRAARDIDNAWGRARALAKLAITIIELVEMVDPAARVAAPL